MKELSILARGFHSLEKRLNVLTDHLKILMESQKNGRFHFIPFYVEEFINQLNMVDEKLSHTQLSHIKFLDVGCGFGTKLLLAKEILTYRSQFKHVSIDGIEIEKSYAEIAKKLLETRNFPEVQSFRSDFHIFETDATKFTAYNEYDIIYLYWPFREDFENFISYVAKEMKPGAFIILNCPRSNWYSSFHDFEVINKDCGYIFRKRISF